MNDDMALVRDYAVGQSEPAFETLVSRYINLIYSAALRQVRDPHLAEEITQAVFIILARKAGKLGADTVLPSWLHRATVFVSADALRAQHSRARREQEAYMPSQSNEPENEVWPQIASFLDTAIASLNEKDRQAIVLRFLQDRSFLEIGAVLGAGEDAAKMRVSRALEKLRRFFGRRGVTSTAETISKAIALNAVRTAPPALAGTVTVIALAKGSASISALTLVKGALKVMAWIKAQTAIVGAVIVGLTAWSVIKHQAQSKLREQNESLQRQINRLSQLKIENQNVSGQLAQANRPKTETAAGNARPAEPATNQAPVAAVPPIEPAPANAGATDVELPKASWTNAGFASPQATLQSRGAAVLNGDRDLFKESVFLTDDARKLIEDTLINMAQISNDPNKTQDLQAVLNNNLGAEEAILMPMMAANRNNGFTGYTILSQQPVSDNEMILQVETDTASGPSQTESLDFQNFGGDWRIVYNKTTVQTMMRQ